MLSACLEYEDILSDKLRGAHPSPFFDKRSDFVDYPSKARLPVAFPKGREPDTHSPTPFFDKRSDFVDYPSKARLPVAFPQGRGGKGQAPTRSGGYVIRLNKRSQVSGARYPPSLGEGLGMGFHSPLPWRLLRRLLRIINPDIQLRRITYPPELLLAPNRRYPPSLGEGPGVGVSYAPNGALICQPRATPGGRGCSRDNAPEGGKRIRSHTKGCGKGKLLFILLPLRGDTDV